jgi:hypothetical protein
LHINNETELQQGHNSFVIYNQPLEEKKGRGP